MRGLPRGDRARARRRSQRGGDLAEPGGQLRLRGLVFERTALRAEAAGHGAARGSRGDCNGSWRGRAGRLRHGADGARYDWSVPAHAALRDDFGLQPKVGSVARLPLERACLGGASRDRVPASWWRRALHRARQLERGRAAARRVRPIRQPALSRRARALRRRRVAVSRARSRSQGQGRGWRRTREEDAAARLAFSRALPRLKRISIIGKSAGRTRASTARRSVK